MLKSGKISKNEGYMRTLYFCIDIGNSHIVAGIYEGYELLHQWRINTVKTRTSDEYFTIFKQLLEESNILISEIEIVAISSVVPRLNAVMQDMFGNYFYTKVINVSAYTELGLSFPMDDPGFIGADLIVNAFAAKEKYKTDAIVIDLGTATTIQLVTRQGDFLGTVIAPGVMTSAGSLFEKASKLAHIELKKSDKILGLNTNDALLSGIITGNALMIDSFIDKIKEQHKELNEIKVIATGGLASMICSDSEQVDIIDPQLTLDGLMRICIRHDQSDTAGNKG